MAISWTKSAELHLASVGPFRIKVQPKGDGRFAWQVFLGEATGPTASGVASSLGAAKRTTEEFVKRSGRV